MDGWMDGWQAMGEKKQTISSTSQQAFISFQVGNEMEKDVPPHDKSVLLGTLPKDIPGHPVRFLGKNGGNEK